MDKKTSSQNSFNSNYKISEVLEYFGYEPYVSSEVSNSIDVTHTKYHHKHNYGEVHILLDYDNKVVNIDGINGTARLRDAFECYAHLYCNGDFEKAAEWEQHEMHITKLAEKRLVLVAKNLSNRKQKLERANDNKDVLEKRLYVAHPLRLTNHLHDDNSLLKNLISEVSELSGQSENSVFLLGLGIFSGITSKAYCIFDSKGDTVPINLFVFVEQSSSNSKNYVLSYFQQPIFDFLDKLQKTKDTFQEQQNNNNQERRLDYYFYSSSEEVDKHIEIVNQSYVPITSITLPAIEKRLAKMNGFCSVVSSENNFINVLSNKNNDLLSSMFDGRFTNIVDERKQLYSGKPVGSIVYFSSGNTIKDFLDFNKPTELQSKFLLLVDKVDVGERFHEMKIKKTDLYLKYCSVCHDILNISKSNLSYNSLAKLKITTEGWKKIFDFRNETETKLSCYLASYPEILILLFDNAETQILKIAANLYLLSSSDKVKTIEHETNEDRFIPLHFVENSIIIFEKSIDFFIGSCVSKNLIGIKSEYESILSIFISQPTSYIRNERQIIQSRLKVEPFKSLISYNKSDYIRNTLKNMVRENLLTFSEPDLYQIK